MSSSSLHDLLREMAAPTNLVSEVEAAELSANNAIIAGTSRAIPLIISGRTTVMFEVLTFDYSTNDGKLRIERHGKIFDLAFSKASDDFIHLYVSGTTRRMARVKQVAMDIPTNMDQHETSSQHYQIQNGDGFLIENEAGDVLAAGVTDIKSDTHGADRDEVTFEFAIFDRGARIFMP